MPISMGTAPWGMIKRPSSVRVRTTGQGYTSLVPFRALPITSLEGGDIVLMRVQRRRDLCVTHNAETHDRSVICLSVLTPEIKSLLIILVLQNWNRSST